MFVSTFYLPSVTPVLLTCSQLVTCGLDWEPPLSWSSHVWTVNAAQTCVFARESCDSCSYF